MVPIRPTPSSSRAPCTASDILRASTSAARPPSSSTASRSPLGPSLGFPHPAPCPFGDPVGHAAATVLPGSPLVVPLGCGDPVRARPSGFSSPGRLPTTAVPVPPVANDHAMRTRGKTGFRQPHLNLQATAISPIPPCVRAALLIPTGVR